MNKEEIEKAKIVLWNIRANTLKAMQCSLAGTKDKEEWLKEIDGIDDIFKYIQQLENKASILDKVTDRLEIASSKYIEEYKKVENLILIDGNTAVLQELSCIIYNLEEILNIIKGEKKYCNNCGVELNDTNKALESMCNNCKYGLEWESDTYDKRSERNIKNDEEEV